MGMERVVNYKDSFVPGVSIFFRFLYENGFIKRKPPKNKAFFRKKGKILYFSVSLKSTWRLYKVL